MDDAQLPAGASVGAFLKSLNKTQVGAAGSKMVAASVGDFVTVLSRSPIHKPYFLPTSSGRSCQRL